MSSAPSAAVVGVSVLLVFCGPLSRTANATEIPDYDKSNYCKSVSAFIKNNAAILHGCEENERSSKAKLQRVWRDVPEETRMTCIQMVELGTVGTYQGLSGCLAISIGNMWMDGKVILKKP